MKCDDHLATGTYNNLGSFVRSFVSNIEKSAGHGLMCLVPINKHTLDPCWCDDVLLPADVVAAVCLLQHRRFSFHFSKVPLIWH